jgi:hypothetical protein
MVSKSFRGGESFHEHADFLPCDVSGGLRRMGLQRRQPVLRLMGSSGAVRHVKRFRTLGRLVATMARTISVAHAAAPFRCRADNNGTMTVISATGVSASHARDSRLAVAVMVPGTNVQDLHLTSPAYHRT